MFPRWFGPKHTFAEGIRLLEAGLRSGEITVKDDSRQDTPSAQEIASLIVALGIKDAVFREEEEMEKRAHAAP
jgi:hypothetical protein